MLGKLGSNGTNSGTSTTLLAPVAPTPVAAGGRPHQASLKSANETSDSWTPWMLVGLLGLWIAWALLEQHQRLRQQVQPKNVAINLRNLAAIVLPVLVGLALLRVALVKFRLWVLPRVPDPVGSWLDGLSGALVRLAG